MQTRWAMRCSKLACCPRQRWHIPVNCPEYLEGVFASFKAGLVPVNTNYRYTDSELQFLWRNADVEAVLFHASFTDRVERVRSSLPSVRLWISVTDGTESCPSWAVDYADLVAGPAGRCGPPYHRSGDDLYLLYTGGTTGAPKGSNVAPTRSLLT